MAKTVPLTMNGEQVGMAEVEVGSNGVQVINAMITDKGVFVFNPPFDYTNVDEEEQLIDCE